jgi:predicted TIM-barrel fold metal-dependent hydrolase
MEVAPLRMHRRSFVKAAALSAGAVAGFPLGLVDAADQKTEGITDTNVSLSRWPFRRLPLDDTQKLVAKLRVAGVTQAWASSFDALLHKNMAAVNEALAIECQKHGDKMLIPFGTVNPRLPDWQEDLRRCHENHRMRGIRLFPNYHGYKLDDSELVKLFAAAESRGLIVQIAMSMEDERVQHPLVRVPNVNAEPLPELLAEFPKLNIVLLNWFRSVKKELLSPLAKTKQVWFDIAMVEGVGGIANLLNDIPTEQILFGSHAPFFYLESSLLKLRESPLSDQQRHLFKGANARRLVETA